MTTSSTRSWVCSSWKITDPILASGGRGRGLAEISAARGNCRRRLRCGICTRVCRLRKRQSRTTPSCFGSARTSAPTPGAMPRRAIQRQAAEFAWRDATISHRRNGVYGAMYFSAVISAAFALGGSAGCAGSRLWPRYRPIVCWRASCAGRWTQAGDIKDYRAGAGCRRQPLRRHAQNTHHQQRRADGLGAERRRR